MKQPQEKNSNAPEIEDNEPSVRVQGSGMAPESRGMLAGAASRDTRIEMQQQIALLESILESLNEGVLVVDSAGNCRAYNRKFSELWNIPPTVSVGPEFFHRVQLTVCDPGTLLELLQGVRCSNAQTSGPQVLELQDGRILECDSQRLNGARALRVFRFRDITAARHKEAQLRQCAYHDPLTGLPNRRLLDDRIGQAIARGSRQKKQFALLFIDLDNLKHINDAHGHDAGDQLLCEAGNRLKNCVREEDTVARFGGDEFVVLLAEVANDGTDAIRVAHKILDELAVRCDISQLRLPIRASIGISLFPDDGNNAHSLIFCADRAMYLAKKSKLPSYRMPADDDFHRNWPEYQSG